MPVPWKCQEKVGNWGESKGRVAIEAVIKSDEAIRDLLGPYLHIIMHCNVKLLSREPYTQT